jgi:molybdopterin-guanine dinucleotide biosynthesis protein A
MTTLILALSAAILAGGASSRMGRNKALLELEGVRLIERVLARLEPLTDDILLSTNEPEPYAFLRGRVRFVPDAAGLGQGPLAGIASTLAAARHPRLLVVAADMPFLNPRLLQYLASLDPPVEITAPVIDTNGLPEPLHTIYSKTILPIVEAQLASGNRKVLDLFPQVRVREVPRAEITPFDPAFHSFFNANTPEEWALAEQLAKEQLGHF